VSLWRRVSKIAKVAAALSGGLSSAVLAFTDVGKLTFDAIIVLVWGTALIAVAAVCVLLSEPPSKQKKPRVGGMILRCMILLVASWIAAGGLKLTAAYHAVRVLRHHCSLCPNVGSIEFRPPRFPVELTISVWVPQTEGVTIEKLSPDSWNQEDPVNTLREENRTQFGRTLILSGFEAPQVFGIWYQLNASADALNWHATPVPDRIRILNQSWLRRYVIWCYVYGGGLWVIGVSYCLSRWFWWGKASP
jgi:hypothetical protein